MTEENILKLQAYLDGELSDADRERAVQYITENPNARDLIAELDYARTVLSGNEPETSVPASREFYWSQISRKIEAAERVPQNRLAASKWWLRYLSPAAAVALAAGMLFNMDRGLNADVDDSAESEGNSVVFHSEAEEVTVVWLHSDVNKDFTSSDTGSNISADDLY